jgi:hypothetical protein
LVIGLGLGTESVKAQRKPKIAGQVLDERGGAIGGANVTIRNAAGAERSATSDHEGRFGFLNLEPGPVSVRVTAKDFAPYDQKLNVSPGADSSLNVKLQIAAKKEEVVVLSGNPLFRGAEYSGGSFILSGEALEALPEGPGGLEAVLRALAVRTAGPFGPQIVLNGFENSSIPLTHSIREIRINDNPFSAEYAKLGLGRIEILTKPGSDKLRGETFFNFGDANLNTRNPFATNRAPYQSRLYGGNLSGPIVAKRATFFVDFSRQEFRSNAVINATTLDPAFHITPLSLAVVTPEYRYSFAPRLDFQLSTNNTLVARYSFQSSHALNSGVGEFSLPSRAQDLTTKVQTVQLTETSVLNPKTINETRFQYVRDEATRSGANSAPVISVPGAFTGGGADIGLAFQNENRWDLQNLTSHQMGRHFIKGGVQLRAIDLGNGSTQNFGGTYLFNGRLAPQLDALNQIAAGAAMVPITSLEAYRRTVLFRSLDYSPEMIRQLGGGASQFSINFGQIRTGVRQYQIGAFLQDDWRLNTRLSLQAGLRYEHQTNIPGDVDFAPRVAFALGLDRAKDQPKTVLRGGVGLFYDRVGEQIVLRARQLNGVNQRQFFTADNSILDLYPVVPSIAQIASFKVPQSVVALAPGIRAPYTIHSSVSLERQLPGGVSAAVTYARIRSLHLLRSRDVNAPLPGAGARPLASLAGIFDYESSGKFDQDQVQANLVYRPSKNMTVWTTYAFSDAMTDTDGSDTFPASSYNLRSEYGRSALTARHTWYFGGWLRTPGNFELTPLVLWRSGLPFNITTGRDNNGDSLFTDRPALATGLSGPNVVVTSFGTFNLNPAPGQPIIPRNYGTGPAFLTANLRVSRKFAFNDHRAMTLAVQGWNIFNHTNAGVPIGSLASPLFGLSNTAAGDWGLSSNQAGNRRLELWIFFTF